MFSVEVGAGAIVAMLMAPATSRNKRFEDAWRAANERRLFQDVL
jgi:hypothetical protein